MTNIAPMQLIYVYHLHNLKAKDNLWVAENKTGLRPIDKHNFTKRYFTNVSKILGFKSIFLVTWQGILLYLIWYKIIFPI